MGGAELHYRPASDYGLSGQQRFADIQAAALARGEIAVGARRSAAELDVLALAPGRGERFLLEPDTLLLVLTIADGA